MNINNNSYFFIIMITIEIMGGLGNQLFQIFTLLSTSIEHKIPFYLEYKEKSSRLDRPFYWENFLQNLSKFIRPLKVDFVYKEPYFHYKQIPCENIPKNKLVKLIGYFQSYKYFHHNKEIIFKLIKLKEQKITLLNKYKPAFFKNTVSLHFRIGDYVHLQNHHPILQMDYYIMAISQLIKITGKDKWKILYFYEVRDKEKIKKKIHLLKSQYQNIVFQSIDHELQDWEQLLIMSLCQHNIIANSTFSWWGAYMNENNNKVFYPNKWFGIAQGNKNTNDLFMDNWIKI